MGKLTPRKEKCVPKLHDWWSWNLSLVSRLPVHTESCPPTVAWAVSPVLVKHWAQRSVYSMLSVWIWTSQVVLGRPVPRWSQKAWGVSRPCPKTEEQNGGRCFIKAHRGFNVRCEKGSELGFVWKGSFWAFISLRFIISPCFASDPGHASHFGKKSTW